MALYVHVPFCVSPGPYCDFVVLAGREARGPANRIAAFSGALESELGKPVITSTQATLWQLLRSAGIRTRIEGYGQLLSQR